MSTGHVSKLKKKGPTPTSASIPTSKNTSEYNSQNCKVKLPILRVVWHKGVISLMHELCVVEITQGHVMMAPLVVSSVARTFM